MRLATFPLPAVDNALSAPTLRFAHKVGGQGDNNITVGTPNASRAPALLVSYVYLKPFLAVREKYVYRDWVLDSGAFSVHRSGAEIKLDDYIAECKRLLAEDPTLTEVFSLDVIGDHVASQRNCEAMWEAGVPAVPCYHQGEPEHVLMSLARDYPKIALGNMAYTKGAAKVRWIGQCFARVWPKKIHGFGLSSETALLSAPFHSVDATSWELSPCRFGNWRAFGGRLSVRGSKQNLRAEIEHYLRLEARAQEKWRKEMALLEELSPCAR